MTGADSSEEGLRLRDLPSEWWAYMKMEWRQRTTFGKLLYPLWFAQAALLWAIILPLILIGYWFRRLEESANEPVIPREWVYEDE